MTSKEKKEFPQKEREGHNQIQATQRERTNKKFQEALEQYIKENPISIDSDLLEQRSQDMEASRIISAEEIRKDTEVTRMNHLSGIKNLTKDADD